MSRRHAEAASVAGPQHQSVELMTDPGVPITPESGTVRVLVADDNTVSTALLRSHLESLGYMVDCAEDGVHALAMAATGFYKVMLLDMHMPVYDGVEVMRRVHLVLGRQLRVIAITAADRSGSRRAELERMGVDGYLTKPVDLAGLQEEMTRVLGLRLEGL